VLTTLVENSRQAGARTVRIVAEAVGDEVVLRVADDGPGVPPPTATACSSPSSPAAARRAARGWACRSRGRCWRRAEAGAVFG
jgi:sensor histidine kinase regulating citrate/malate metabolism